MKRVRYSLANRVGASGKERRSVTKGGSMKNEAKKFSPAVFGLAIICFFLPFTHISCSGERVATLTGIQLVTGTTIGNQETDSAQTNGGPFIRPSDVRPQDREDGKIDPEPLAIFALCSTIAGLWLSFRRGKEWAIATAVAGGVGLILLLLLKAKIDNDVLKEGEGIVQVEYAFGFWLLLVLFLSAIGLNAYLCLPENKEEQVLSVESKV